PSRASLEANTLLGTVVAARRYDEPLLQRLETIPAQQLLSRRAWSADWASAAARAVTALAVSPDNTVIAGGTDDGYLFVWDASTGDLRHSVVAHRDYIEDLVFTLDGTRVVTSGRDGITCVWDLTSAERRHRLVHHQR